MSNALTERERFIAYLESLPDRTADALVLFQGDGHSRVSHAARLYREGAARAVILVGGADNREYGSYPSQELHDLLRAEGVAEGDIAFEPGAMHTRAEVDRAMEIAAARGWQSLLLVSSPYHMFRVVLSYAAAMRQHRLPVVGYPAPIRNLPLFEKNPWGVRAELYDREFERIAVYQAKGDVASFAEGLEYLRSQAVT